MPLRPFLAALCLTAAAAQAQQTDAPEVAVTDSFGNPVITMIDPGVAGPAFTDAYVEAAEGRRLFTEGDYADGLALLRPLADAGNPVAQNIVGIALTERNGELDAFYDPEPGHAYLLAAAEQGLPLAMHNLGHFYTEEHDGLAPDAEESLRWHRAAANLGYVESYYDLAHALASGAGTEPDTAEARLWADRAMEGSEAAEALSLLGDMAYYGEGEPSDLTKALRLFEESAAAGGSYGAYSAGYMHYFGEGTPVDDAKALVFFSQAAASGEIRAFGYLAEMHREGFGTEVDLVAARDWAARGAELGDGFAMYELAGMLAAGEGGPQDYAAARAMAERAVEAGEYYGYFVLANLAANGLGEPQNEGRAFSLYQSVLAQDPEDPLALYSTGFMTMRGQGTPQDIPAALDLLVRAAPDEPAALYELPVIYGHPDFAGPWQDAVQAYAGCLRIAAAGIPIDPVMQDETRLVCDALPGDLTAEQRAAAEVLAAQSLQ